MKKTPKAQKVQRGGDKPAFEKTYVFQLEVKAPPYQFADDQRCVGAWAQDDIGTVFQDAICSYLEWKMRWMTDETSTDEAKKRQIAYNDAKRQIAEDIIRTIKFVGEKKR